MRMLRVKLNWSSAGAFWFWAAALLVLPNCTLDRSGIVSPTNLYRGVFDAEDPLEAGYSSAIFCDIEEPVPRRCATAEDIEGAIRLQDAAIALVEGRTSTIGGLDYSPAATAMCGGQPQVVEFHGPFPQGSNICLHCGTAIGPGMDQHADNAAVCTARCLDLFDPFDENVPPSAEALAFCTPERAHLSTNFPANECFTGACSINGQLDDAYADPRRNPEIVHWMNLDGVSDNGGGTLTRTAPYTGVADAGASSEQLIAGGDAYFQFIATETTSARAAGLSSGAPPAGGIEFTDIGFGILLLDGEIHVIVNGSSVGTFGAYAADDRFRVKLRDNLDGNATVSFARRTGCVGSTCIESAIEPPATYTVAYPVRVDAMIREFDAAVTAATLVRIR
jgi:hypothetical protein